jgi:hypothetical protein
MPAQFIADPATTGGLIAAVLVLLVVVILALVVWSRRRADAPVRAYDREQRELASFRRRLSDPTRSYEGGRPRKPPPPQRHSDTAHGEQEVQGAREHESTGARE